MTEMQAKIPFRAKVREVGHVESGFNFQVSGFRGLGARVQVSGFTCHPLCPSKLGVTRSKAPEGVCYKVKGEM